MIDRFFDRILCLCGVHNQKVAAYDHGWIATCRRAGCRWREMVA